MVNTKWANRPIDDSDIERTPEYEQFMESLRAYHQNRGTELTPEPEIYRKKIDLLKLYKLVTSHGGYDRCSEEKGVWRDLANTYKLSHTNAGYLLKSAYYKNLAAYEIKFFHGKEPPPKELVEDRTAAGGGIMGRTFENMPPLERGEEEESPSVERGRSDARGSARGEGDSMSPSAGGMKTEGSSSVTRSLRHAPPKREFYTPPVTSRATVRTAQPRTPTPNNVNPSSAPMVQSNSQQQQQSGPPQPPHMSYSGPSQYSQQTAMMPSTSQRSHQGQQVQGQGHQLPQRQINTQSVYELSKNPKVYSSLQEFGTDDEYPVLNNDWKSGNHPADSWQVPPIAPARRNTGCSIRRVYMMILSGIPDEIEDALYHLVEYSFSNTEKLQAEDWPMLAEKLIEMLEDANDMINYVTPDKLPFALPQYARRFSILLDTAIVLRNMTTDPRIASRLSKNDTLRKTLLTIIYGPEQGVWWELHKYALDIAESICQYLSAMDVPHFFKYFLSRVMDPDRNIRLISLRSMSALMANGGIPNFQPFVSVFTDRFLDDLINSLIPDDEELNLACLDFLIEYTYNPENAERLMKMPQATSYLNTFVRKLSFGADEVVENIVVRTKNVVREPAPENSPTVPTGLLAEIMSYSEPERATMWLRCCFEEDPDAEITQIKLWQSYQTQFMEFVPKRPLLQAADFIKNVSVTFPGANAMVVPALPPATGQRFIIKGIKPRATPAALNGQVYVACLWTASGPPAYTKCNHVEQDVERLWNHIMERHCAPDQVQADGNLYCQWFTCGGVFPSCQRKKFLAHVATHMPGPVKRTAPTTVVDTASASSSGIGNPPTISTPVANASLGPAKFLKPKPTAGALVLTRRKLRFPTISVPGHPAPPGHPPAPVRFVERVDVPKSATVVLAQIGRTDVGRTMLTEGPVRAELAERSFCSPALAGLVGNLMAELVGVVGKGEGGEGNSGGSSDED